MTRLFPKPTLAVGPRMPDWGSWNWLGPFFLNAGREDFIVRTFEPGETPAADLVVVVKHLPDERWFESVSRFAGIIYCPVDHYGSAESIESDAAILSRCVRVVVHSESLLSHFQKFAPTSYLDHPIRFATPLRADFRGEGDFLWVGVHSNIPPLADWFNANGLPGDLTILSNIREGETSPADWGFADSRNVRIRSWSPEEHLKLTANCRAALDIKGSDFRSKNKPPAKAVDFLASGVPLAMNRDSSPAEYLAARGLILPEPSDISRWLSREYAEEVKRYAGGLLQTHVEESLLPLARNLFRDALNVIVTASHGGTEGIASETPIVKPKNFENEKIRDDYLAAQKSVEEGRIEDARILLELILAAGASDLRSMALNDLAVIAANSGDLETARKGFEAVLKSDPSCETAKSNLETIKETVRSREAPVKEPVPDHASPRRVRVALLSFLFNWPSSGGGITHTVELGHFLAEAGYDVRHFYVKFEPWGIGRVTGRISIPSEQLEFSESNWNVASIQSRFRIAVDRFDPDYAILSDSWNFKPLLARAVSNRRFILRLQALECICPLNNVRLLPLPDGVAGQCPSHQLATPAECGRCVSERGRFSGDLHRAERSLCDVGSPEYDETLRWAFRQAEAVLVVNPLTEAMISPYARSTRVVTAGMDPARFPWPPPREPNRSPGKLRILFAGLVDEWMKGYRVLQEAGEIMWKTRRDFEIVATADPEGRENEFTVFEGWRTQESLPPLIRSCDILVIPTIAQEALGRTAVEAMAAGKPVVASRLGGLSFTVTDGGSGLLARPGDPRDLAAKLCRLLDDPTERERMGKEGRRRFEEDYAWPVIIERHYRPLLVPIETAGIASDKENGERVSASYSPHFPGKMDHDRLRKDTAGSLGISLDSAGENYILYRRTHETLDYERRFGEFKTLCFEEAYVIYCAVRSVKPRSIIVIGAQQGQSTRRIIDLSRLAGINLKPVCFDFSDQIEHFSKDEADLRVCDLRGKFDAEVLRAHQPGLIFVDEHNRDLLDEIIRGVLADRRNWTLVLHDCGRGLCNPRMRVSEGDEVTSMTGVWERHLLARAFGVEDPLSERLDATSNASHRLTIFETTHGLAVVRPLVTPDGTPR